MTETLHVIVIDGGDASDPFEHFPTAEAIAEVAKRDHPDRVVFVDTREVKGRGGYNKPTEKLMRRLPIEV